MSLVQEQREPGSQHKLAGLLVRCMECGATTQATGSVAQCHRCGGLLDALIELNRTVHPEEFNAPLPTQATHSGVWRSRTLLPPIPEEAIVSRAEGGTPIYW